jgi:excisionase family DNA binding protein
MANPSTGDDLFRQLTDSRLPHRLSTFRPLFPFTSEARSRTMNPLSWEDAPHLGAGSRYRPTPAADGRSDRPPPAATPRAQESPWPSASDPGDRRQNHPPTSPGDLIDPVESSTTTLRALPEVLTAREAAAILRVGRNQLYQAVGRGELGAIRIGRSIRVPRQALLDLLASTGPVTASSNEQPRQPATQVRQGPP